MFAWRGNSSPALRVIPTSSAKDRGESKEVMRLQGLFWASIKSKQMWSLGWSHSCRCKLISCQNNISELMLGVHGNHHMKFKFRHFQPMAKANPVKPLYTGVSSCLYEHWNTGLLPQTPLGKYHSDKNSWFYIKLRHAEDFEVLRNIPYNSQQQYFKNKIQFWKVTVFGGGGRNQRALQASVSSTVKN